MNPILDKYIMVAPAISKLFLSDVGVAVTDREQFVYYQPGKTLDLKVPFGASVKPNMITYVAMKEKRRVVEKRDADLWGVPFIAWAIPLTDDAGVVIGSLTIQENVEQQEVLTGLASNLANSINLLAATAEQVTAQSQEASAACDSMLEVMRHSQYKVGETDQIVGLIKGIAGQTNLLGLNAAIESTRVGERGRGFGVIAEEIRRLATSSSESANKVSKMIDDIQSNSNKLNNEIVQIKDVVSEIAKAIFHVTETIQEVGQLAESLDKIATKMLDSC